MSCFCSELAVFALAPVVFSTDFASPVHQGTKQKMSEYLEGAKLDTDSDSAVFMGCVHGRIVYSFQRTVATEYPEVNLKLRDELLTLLLCYYYYFINKNTPVCGNLCFSRESNISFWLIIMTFLKLCGNLTMLLLLNTFVHDGFLKKNIFVQDG